MERKKIGLPIKKFVARRLAKSTIYVTAYIPSPWNIYYKCCAADGFMQWDSWPASLQIHFYVFSSVVCQWQVTHLPFSLLIFFST